jgi:hypothetical protein
MLATRKLYYLTHIAQFEGFDLTDLSLEGLKIWSY